MIRWCNRNMDRSELCLSHCIMDILKGVLHKLLINQQYSCICQATSKANCVSKR